MVNIINGSQKVSINPSINISIILPIHKITNNDNGRTLISKAKENKSKHL